MSTLIIILLVLLVVVALLAIMSIRVIKQYEKGVILRFGRLNGVREPGIRLIVGLSEERCVRVRPDPRGDGRG